MSSHPMLIELDEGECLRLLAPGGVGRLGFTGRFGLTVLPVNYRLLDGAVIFRTVAGGTTEQDLRTGIQGACYEVAFEVDHIEEAARIGWSVLVRGSLHHITADDERAAAAATGLEPWAGGDRQQYLRIAPARITGRRIVTDS